MLLTFLRLGAVMALFFGNLSRFFLKNAAIELYKKWSESSYVTFED